MSANELLTLARLEHRGRDFRLERLERTEPAQWKITDPAGRNCGTLVMMDREGEGGDPVYGGIRPGETQTEFEGSDWDAIARGLINETESD